MLTLSKTNTKLLVFLVVVIGVAMIVGYLLKSQSSNNASNQDLGIIERQNAVGTNRDEAVESSGFSNGFKADDFRESSERAEVERQKEEYQYPSTVSSNSDKQIYLDNALKQEDTKIRELMKTYNKDVDNQIAQDNLSSELLKNEAYRKAILEKFRIEKGK